MVGTASVVALMSSGQLAAEEALAQFKALGTDLMSVSFKPQNYQQEEVPLISTAKLEQMAVMIADINQMAAFMTVYTTAYFQETSWNTVVIGATPALASVIAIHLEKGRFLTPMDKQKNYCILGEITARNLKTPSLIGSRIKLGNELFTVIGIAKHWPENSFFPQDINQSIIVPIQSMPLINNRVTLSDAVMRLNKQASIESVKQAITDYLQKIAPSYLISLQSAQEIVLRMSAQQHIFTLLLALIGSIALLVGGIGVMNIMLASVSERRNEIGLRLALGAEPRDIQRMFIMESVVLALIGGTLGVIIGIASTVLIAKVAGWSFTLFFLPPVIGLGVSILVSIFFGFYPAYKASLLNPIEALRGV